MYIIYSISIKISFFECIGTRLPGVYYLLLKERKKEGVIYILSPLVIIITLVVEVVDDDNKIRLLLSVCMYSKK